MTALTVFIIHTFITANTLHYGLNHIRLQLFGIIFNYQPRLFILYSDIYKPFTSPFEK